MFGFFFVFFYIVVKKQPIKVCSDPKPERMYHQTCRELNVKQPLSLCCFLCLERRVVLKTGVVLWLESDSEDKKPSSGRWSQYLDSAAFSEVLQLLLVLPVWVRRRSSKGPDDEEPKSFAYLQRETQESQDWKLRKNQNSSSVSKRCNR